MSDYLLFVTFFVLLFITQTHAQSCNSISGTGYLYTNGTCISSQPPLLYQNFPLLTVPDQTVAQSYQLGYKSQNLPLLAWTNISSVSSSGSGGMIRKLWLALSGPGVTNQNIASLTFLSIVFDNAPSPQVGPQPVSPVYQTALEIDILFTAGFYSSTCTNSELFGCSNVAGNTFGGYITFNMPFKSNFTIYLYTIAASAVSYWVQTEYEIYSTSYRMTPLYFYLQPQYVSSVSYPNEVPILSQISSNGVYLKYMKWAFFGNSGSWWEGRFRIYTGGSGLTGQISGTHYTDGTYTVSTPYGAGAAVIWMSTGTEDGFDSSWNFVGSSYFAFDYAGYLYNSGGASAGLSSSTEWTAYRQWGTRPLSIPPHSQPQQYLVFTWTCGDPLVEQSGSAQFIAYVGYYA